MLTITSASLLAVLFATPLQAADRSDDIAALQKQLQQIKDQLSSIEGTARQLVCPQWKRSVSAVMRRAEGLNPSAVLVNFS